MRGVVHVIDQTVARAKHLFTDGAYHHLKLRAKATYLDFIVEIIHRRDGAKGFEVCHDAGWSRGPLAG